MNKNKPTVNKDNFSMTKVLASVLLISLMIGAIGLGVSNCSRTDEAMNQSVPTESTVSSDQATPSDPTATTVDTSTVPQLGTYWYDATTDSVFMIYADSYYSYISVGKSVYDEGIYHQDIAATDPDTAFYSNRHVRYLPFTYENGVLTVDGVTFTQYNESDFANIYNEFTVRVNDLMIGAFENSQNEPNAMYHGTAWQCVGVWLHAQEVIEFYSISDTAVGMRRLSDGHETFNGEVIITTGEDYDYKVTFGENSFEFTFGQSGNSLIVSENGAVTVYY